VDCPRSTSRNPLVRCGEFERFGIGTESRLEMMWRVSASVESSLAEFHYLLSRLI
jgi:hypothetical protein